MKTSTIVAVLAALIVILGGWYWWAQNGGPAMPGFGSMGGPQACTMEARVCPDGSAVGRTGPNCAFAPCPTPSNTTNTGNTSNQSTPPNPAPLGNTGTAADDPGLGDASAPAR